MPYKASILLDSISKDGSKRITTWELSYPRMVHSELMTHRLFSRNSSSSRAIPIQKMIKNVQEDPAMPVWFGKNQTGMSARESLDPESIEKFKQIWLNARDEAINSVNKLTGINAHKQIANRLLEPWMFITVILTASDFENFFKLRCHEDAQPEIKYIADMMKKLYDESKPQVLEEGQWHIPMLYPDEQYLELSQKLKISTARCARVSYLTHDGRKDYIEDEKLHDRLASSGHYSPFEHCAKLVSDDDYMLSNISGWNQYRKSLNGENGKCK